MLFDPNGPHVSGLDPASSRLLHATIEFFEARGKKQLKQDDLERTWYAEFLDFVGRERVFATLCTPAEFGKPGDRWDTWRLTQFAEAFAFYGLHHWYTWQVSVLGLGPIWMSRNHTVKQRAARLLDGGGIFAFGLSERSHGADVYSTEMQLTPTGDGHYVARGEKYYIGNGNEAALVSVFGKNSETGEYVFFVVESQHEKFRCIRNVVNVQSYVSHFALEDYPIEEADILSTGQEAWDAALNTVNIGKFNLGWASIGICTHALYEAVHHAAHRRLYGQAVTDFPHVKQLFTDAYTRLAAMRTVAQRASDYMRAASPDDRRYLLYNPVVKMKVTTQGEDVINHLWDVIAAKGFESDTYFEMAARDIRALPKLEGTVHVNIALIIKFMANYFFEPTEYPEVSRLDGPENDDFLFQQGPTRGLSHIRFHDYRPVFEACEAPNAGVFLEQVEAFRALLAKATPGQSQSNDVDFLMAVGELFTLVVYAQLFLEGTAIADTDRNIVDQTFDVFVRDFSRHAVVLHGKPTTTPEQAQHCLQMIRRPHQDPERFTIVWEDTVLAQRDVYEMRP